MTSPTEEGILISDGIPAASDLGDPVFTIAREGDSTAVDVVAATSSLFERTQAVTRNVAAAAARKYLIITPSSQDAVKKQCSYLKLGISPRRKVLANSSRNVSSVFCFPALSTPLAGDPVSSLFFSSPFTISLYLSISALYQLMESTPIFSEDNSSGRFDGSIQHIQLSSKGFDEIHSGCSTCSVFSKVTFPLIGEQMLMV